MKSSKMKLIFRKTSNYLSAYKASIYKDWEKVCMKAIEVQGVSKWYGDFQAVKDVSFEVNAGEIFAILGPNGAGKSTTIRMILDIIKPDTGMIRVLGAP